MYIEIIYLDRLGVKLPMYTIKNINKLFDKKIVIYGAGRVGFEFYNQLINYKNISIEEWVDSFPEKSIYKYCNIKSPDVLRNILYDYILIAVKNENTANEIKGKLKSMGIKEEKIIWEYPNVV